VSDHVRTMPKTIERPAPVDLTVSSPSEPDDAGRLARLPYLPWVAAAMLGSGAAVLLGWVAVGAVLAVGWLTDPTLSPPVVLDALAQAWVGVHGAPFRLAGMTIGLTPLGLTALVGVAMSAVARYSAGQRDDGRSGLVPALLVAGVCTLTYSLLTLLVATLVGAPRQAASAFVGALLVSGVGSLIGALRALGGGVLAALPAWVRGLPVGVGIGLASLVAASGAALVVAIGSHLGAISALNDALAPDAVGSALLVVCYLAYGPTLLLWAGSYMLGAGVQLGTGALITPTSSVLELLPGLPIFGAVPTVPPANGVLLLACGPLAGLLAGTAACWRASRHGRQGVLVTVVGAALSALLTGTIWTAASWFSRGSLGTARLVGLGPRFPELLGYGTLPAAAGGLVSGLVFAAIARRPRDVGGEDGEDTVVVRPAKD
jgi:Family of unknown function (DUF6350)